MRWVSLAAECERRAILGRGDFEVGPSLRSDQAKQNGLRVGRTIRQGGCRMKLDVRAHPTLVLRDFERAPPKDRSGIVHLGCSEKTESQEAHFDVRQQKHQQGKLKTVSTMGSR
jgi:hypothetical protein